MMRYMNVTNDEQLVLKEIDASGKVDLLVQGFHPFSWACQMSNIRFLRRLIKMDGDVNFINSDGTTALTWAPNSEFTRALVSLGAKVSVELDELTSMHRAADKGLADQLKLLLTKSDGLSRLESFDFVNRTPLACAAAGGHEDALSLLLEFGANPNAYNSNDIGYTVIQFALEEGHLYIAHLLIEAGAEPPLLRDVSRGIAGIAKDQEVGEEMIEGIFLGTGPLKKQEK